MKADCAGFAGAPTVAGGSALYPIGREHTTPARPQSRHDVCNISSVV